MSDAMTQSTSTLEVEELVQLARKGTIRVPDFQRPFRWQQSDAVKLFESILEGYPIGNLLFWERPGTHGTVSLGDLDITAQPDAHALWVVDGQQRTTVIVNVLTEGTTNPAFDVVYNLQTKEIVAAGRDPDSEVPLYVATDLQRILHWVIDHPLHKEYIDEISRVGATIRRYKIATFTVRGREEPVVRDIFDRLNNTGKRLTRAEVFHALHHNGGEEPSDLEEIAAFVDAHTGFGTVPKNVALNCVLATRGHDISRDLHHEFLDDGDRLSAFESTAAAMRSAISFLQQHAGVPHYDFLPYPNLLVVLTRISRYFATELSNNPRAVDRLRVWFWRAASRPQSATTAEARKLLGSIEEHSLSSTLQSLLDSPFELRALSVAPMRKGTAASKILSCLYWMHDPLSSTTGEPVTVDQLASMEGSHLTQVLPRTKLPSSFSSSFARFLLDPSLDGVDLRDWQIEAPSHSYLESHFFDPATVGVGDVAELLRQRSDLMQKYFDGKLAKLTLVTPNGKGAIEPELLELPEADE